MGYVVIKYWADVLDWVKDQPAGELVREACWRKRPRRKHCS